MKTVIEDACVLLVMLQNVVISRHESVYFISSKVSLNMYVSQALRKCIYFLVP